MRTKMVISWIFFVVFLGTSRSLFAQTISINIKNVTLEETLKKIKQVSGFDMVFKMKDIKDIKERISLQVEDKDIRDVLQSCLQEHGLIFNIYNKTIIISRKPIQTPEMRTIKGYIHDDSHQPLAEASIRLEGSQLGTISNKNGEFIFRIPARNKSRLVVSYIGKKTAYIPLSHDSLYLIMLETAVSQVENIIVNGYQTVAKNEMTGAVSTIKGKDIRTSGSNSLEAAFQGMLNGLEVIIPSGNIGSTGHMKIRGASTVVGNPEPLVVVDGIIRENAWAFDQNTLYDLLNNGNLANATRASIMGNNLSGINVDDIASITLLKDVSATAIYGIRATNGVIVITTKQGNINNQKITFRSDITFSPVPSYRNTNVMNSTERVNLSKEIIEAGIALPDMPQDIGYEAIYRDMISKKISYPEFNKQVSQLEKQNTNWFKILGRTAISQNYHLNITSGKKNISYYASLGYRDERNAFKGNDRQTFTGMLNFNIIPSNNIKLTLYLSGSDIKTDGYYMSINPEQYALNTSRAIGPSQFYQKGKGSILNYIMDNTSKIVQKPVHFNLLHELQHTGNNNHATNIHLNAQLTWQILSNLSINFTSAWSSERSRSKLWADEYSWNIALLRGADYGVLQSSEEFPFLKYLSPLLEGGLLDYSNMTHEAYTLKGQANYRCLFGKKQLHAFSMTLGIEIRQNKYTGETGIELGYTPNKISEYNYSSQEKRFQYIRNNFPGIYPREPQNYSLKDHEMHLIDRVENVFSLYGTLGYTFNSLYTFTLNIRNDASNRFGKNTNNRFYPVWSTGFRWDLHQEKWLPRQKWINEITLRTSYGHQGNVVSNISPNTLVSYVSKDLITNEEQLQLDQLSNPDLKWEKTTSLNIGTDFSLFQNRLNISFDLYKKKISDIVVEKEIPIENGFQKMFINSGTLDNQGYELEIEAIPVQTNLWEWRIRFTAGHTKDILDRSDADQQTLEHFTNGSAIVDRFPISAFWSFPFIGLSPTNGSPLFATMDQPNGVSQKVPDSLLEYLMYSGCSEPRLFGGIQTNIRYKRITLNAIFNYQAGHYKRLNPFISSSRDGMMAIPRPEMNASRELLYRWKQAGDEKATNIPSLQNKDEDVSCYLPDNSLSINSYGDIYRYSLYNRSNARVVSASHIRCNRISLSYHTTLARIADLNLSFTITNPFIIKNRKLKQQDPEISTSDADYYTPTMSRPKNYSLGIEIIF